MKMIRFVLSMACFFSIDLFGASTQLHLGQGVVTKLPEYYPILSDDGMSMKEIIGNIGNLGSTTLDSMIVNPFWMVLTTGYHVSACNVQFCGVGRAKWQAIDLYKRCSRRNSTESLNATNDSYIKHFREILSSHSDSSAANSGATDTGKSGIKCHLFCNRFVVQRDIIHHSRHLETFLSNFSAFPVANVSSRDDNDAIKRLAIFLSSSPGNNLANSVLHRYLRKINQQFLLLAKSTGEDKQSALREGIISLRQGKDNKDFNVDRYLHVMGVLRSIHCKHLNEWRADMSGFQRLTNAASSLVELLKEADCEPLFQQRG